MTDKPPRVVEWFTDEEAPRFWQEVREVTAQHGVMQSLVQAGALEMPETLRQILDQPYRLSWLCDQCEKEHRIRGSFHEVLLGVQLLVLHGARSVLIEPEAWAVQMDADEAHEEPLPEGPDVHGVADRLAALLRGKPHD